MNEFRKVLHWGIFAAGVLMIYVGFLGPPRGGVHALAICGAIFVGSALIAMSIDRRA